MISSQDGTEARLDLPPAALLAGRVALSESGACAAGASASRPGAAADAGGTAGAAGTAGTAGPDAAGATDGRAAPTVPPEPGPVGEAAA
jgi:hypothetical protein